MVVNGAASSSTIVTSGVPQGTVLGPLLFLLYINDLPDNLSTSVRLFADDCILYNNNIILFISYIIVQQQDVVSKKTPKVQNMV